MITHSVAEVTKAAADSRFGGFKREPEVDVRTTTIRKDGTLTRITDAWQSFAKAGGHTTGIAEKDYAKARGFATNLEYSPMDVEKFSLALAEPQSMEHFGHRSGIFLSMLINDCSGTDFTIHTSQLPEEIQYFGYRNRKNVRVIGDVGHGAFCCMECGNVMVDGNASTWLGKGMGGGMIEITGNAFEAGWNMKGGRILVHGNVTRLAMQMRGGVVEVMGNAGHDIGPCMRNSELRIHGMIGGVSALIGRNSRIYHGDELVLWKCGLIEGLRHRIGWKDGD